MPILAALSILKPFASAAWSFATSRLGQIILVAAVAYGVGHHHASQACAAREAAERAALASAHQAEIAREEAATREIAAAATQRAEEDAGAARAQQQIINRLKSETAHVALVKSSCNISNTFVNAVKEFDKAGGKRTKQ